MERKKKHRKKQTISGGVNLHTEAKPSFAPLMIQHKHERHKSKKWKTLKKNRYTKI